MELEKAKSLIIVMLLAFNIFLLCNNLNYFNGQGVRNETVENAELILNDRGVVLECSIPKSPRDLHRLKYGSSALDRTELANKLLHGEFSADDSNSIENAEAEFKRGDKKIVFNSDTEFIFTDKNPSSVVNVDSVERAQKYVWKMLEDAGLLSRGYIVDELQKNKDGSVSVTYIESFDGMLIFDNYCSVIVTDKGITQIEYCKRQIIGFSPQIAENQADAYQVLLSHFTEASSVVITGIDIGYKYSCDNMMEHVQSTEKLPLWRVKIKGKVKPLYLGDFNALEQPEITLNAG